MIKGTDKSKCEDTEENVYPLRQQKKKKKAVLTCFLKPYEKEAGDSTATQLLP